MEMMFGERRRGSALLIVLGMFAFMLVSAITFSVYMRASRSPSSYVRKNSASHQLLKAAVARAIDELDTAIGNDPYPGLGYNHDSGSNGINKGDKTKNDDWHGHVFTPSNEVAASETVSTLSLEALGYIPACMINEVRYWSRHTRTAKWHSFNYGLGRYAFTAVNVSDLFELNSFVDYDGVAKQRLNRSSSEYGRISPTYLFRSNEKSDMDDGSSTAAGFLRVMASGSGLNLGSSPSLLDVPLVSMMDFNLALGGTAVGGVASPFVKRLNGSSGGFYNSVGDDVVRRMVFNAGGWDGSSNLTYQAYRNTYGNRIDLHYGEFQPFSDCTWFPESTTLAHCYNDVSASHPFWYPFNDNFPILATALLCDYLDYDSVPLSLCIPSVENTPMLCGIEMNDGCVNYDVKVTETVIEEADPTSGKKKKIKRSYTLNCSVDGVEATLTAVYPFANGPQGSSSSFTAEFFARVFFTATSGDAWGKGLRSSVGDLDLGDNFTWSVVNSTAKAYIQVNGSSADVTAKEISGSGESAEKSAIQGNIALKSSGSQKLADVMLAELVYEVDSDGNETLVDAECKNGDGFTFFDGSWQAVNFLDKIKSGSDGTTIYSPSIAVWARIKDGNGKTVDMVPAIPAYDSLNGFAANAGLNGFNKAGGGNAGTPLLRFFQKDSDGNGIKLTQDYFKDRNGAAVSVQWTQKAYVANDPRYNWAPEQWYATESATDPKQLWFNNVKSFRDANSWCDTDIFMQSSDQGYLQSMYEWMMVPQTRSLSTTANAEWGVLEGSSGDYDGVVRTAYDNVAHKNLMWRTYRADAFGSTDWGSIDDLGFDDFSNGPRVNPFTDITNVMMGAFANMPRDWWAASTNEEAKGKSYMSPSSYSFKNDYIFDWSTKYADVYDLTEYMMKMFRNWKCDLYQADAWQNLFENCMNWKTGVPLVQGTSGSSAITSIMQDEMNFADRKFFYGYLKGCFANRSQLYLLFVRAESSAGGATGGGVKGVALVYRDPAAPSFSDSGTGTGKDNAGKYLQIQSGGREETWRLNSRKYPPHRTRVLFYHQFD